MTHYKAIKVLKRLSVDEFKHFGKFLKSPFFNSNKNLIKFYAFLKKHFPEFKFKNEQAFRYLFPGKKYYDAKIRQLLSEIYRLCEDFLAHSSLDNDLFYKKLYVIKNLDERKLDSLFLKNVKKMELELNSPKMEFKLYQKKAELEEALTEFFILRENAHKIKYHDLKRGEYFLISVLKTLEFQFIEMKMQEYNYGKPDIPNIMHTFINHIDLQGFSSWLDKNMCDAFTYIALICNDLLMEANPEDESLFYKFKNLYFDNYQILHDNDKIYFLNALVDYCNIKLSYGGFEKLRKELFELNKLSLTFLELPEGKLTNARYLSILENALALCKFQWVESFIHDYSKYTEEEQVLRNYALARLCFERSKYEKSLDYLKPIKTSDPVMKFFIKRLTIKLYYELDMLEPGISYLDSLKHFRRNSKAVGEIILKRVDKEIRILGKLFNLKIYPEKINKKTLSELKEFVPVEAPEFIRKWFTAKICELEKKQKKQRSFRLYTKDFKTQTKITYSPAIKEYINRD